jgi:hypothetical protein
MIKGLDLPKWNIKQRRLASGRRIGFKNEKGSYEKKTLNPFGHYG